MEERNTTGDFLYKNISISTWETPITAPNGSIYTDFLDCVIMYQAMSFLFLIFALVGMAGNAMVLWLLGFHMHRNAFSVYILNLAVADFLFLCFQHHRFQWNTLKLFLQRALQDAPEEEEGGERGSSEETRELGTL
ncbi:mas-related G-protein coupled receptor member B2-like isoform X2 [Peromyscus maniculatus bairdii]|uniref:mas-related G-protein coupled receptor member B2-like isoform X2 n=1 Tax=Peromyscus maniculatus bairdii TaxID=230844 RepID=UPI003FD440A0